MPAPNAAPTDGDSAKSVFLAWERLRVLYNLVLAVFVLLVGHDRIGQQGFVAFIGVNAVLANVCFSIGPVIEGYAALVGVPRAVSRRIVMAAGTIVGCGLAKVSLRMWALD